MYDKILVLQYISTNRQFVGMIAIEKTHADSGLSRSIYMFVTEEKRIYMNNATLLKETIRICGSIGTAVLDGKAEGGQYKAELLKLLGIMRVITDDDIRAADYPQNIENTIRMDKYLIEGTVTEEFDQLSLLSTLVTYAECNSEGRPGHSAAYMDRVTALRKVIEEEYGTEAMRFCGSDGC